MSTPITLEQRVAELEEQVLVMARAMHVDLIERREQRGSPAASERYISDAIRRIAAARARREEQPIE